MNKPIIIDGVDVAECNKYDGNSYIECLNDQTTSRKCKGNPDCYFKQLQRLKAKNERLKAENEKLKKNKKYQLLAIQNLNNKVKILTFVNKYKQALEEVREIIHFRFKTPYMKLGLKETDKIIEDIEKIINEVLKDAE